MREEGASVLRSLKQKASIVLKMWELEKGRRGGASCEKVLSTKSEWRKVSLRFFPLFPTQKFK